MKDTSCEIIIIDDETGRLDIMLSDRFDITRSQVKKLIDCGAVNVNGSAVKAGYMLKKGDNVEAALNTDEPDGDIEPQDIPIDVVYEDGELAVINKAQGMVVHPAAGIREGTLVNALLYRFGGLSGIGGNVRPGIVHRLDKDTSGLMVVAKTVKAHYSLAGQIANKTAIRRYLALVEGVVKTDCGTIDMNLIRDPRNRKTFTTAKSGGKTAVSDYWVKERYAKRTLMEFGLRTGRTHQIRVHAKYLGHPVTGDTVYGYKTQEYKLNGQLLHSHTLSFEHPVTGERLEFCSELPDNFRSIIDKQRQTIYNS